MENTNRPALDPSFVKLVCNMLHDMDTLHDQIQELKQEPSEKNNVEIRVANEKLMLLYGQFEAIGLVEWKSAFGNFKLKLFGDAPPGEYTAILSAREVIVMH